MSRRTRTKDSKQEDVDNDNANDDNNNIHQWSIISPGSSECYFGLAGEAIPSFSVSDPWSSLDVLPDALFASNAPFILRKFTDHFLNDRPLVVCVPVTLPSESRVRICKSFFEMTKISAICLLSEPVACSFACGQVNMSSSGSSASSSSHHHSHSSSDTSSTSGVTVIDLGWSHATTSFVEQGRSTKFVSSSSLGLKRFFQLKQQEQKQQQSSSQSSKQHQEELDLPTKSLSEEEFNNSPFKHEIASWYLNSSHLESMCSKMPLRALQHHPIVLVGGGGGCDGLGSGLSKLLKKVVYNKKKKYEDDDDDDSNSSDEDEDEDEEEDGDDDNDDVQKKSKEKNKKKTETNLENIRVSNIFRVPVSASRLFAFRGASLLSSCGVLDEMMVASIIVGSSSSSTSSSSTSPQQQQQYHFTAKQKQSANNTLGCVISREEWMSAVEKIRAKSLWNQSVSSDQMMIEFLSWRFPK